MVEEFRPDDTANLLAMLFPAGLLGRLSKETPGGRRACALGTRGILASESGEVSGRRCWKNVRSIICFQRVGPVS